MTAPALNEQLHWNAIQAAIADPDWPIYDDGDVPGLDGNDGEVPRQYVVLAPSRRYVETRRLVGLQESSGWRITCEPFAPSAARVRVCMARLSQALEGRRLVVDGHASTPIQHEASDEPARSRGGFETRVSWTYAL